MDASTHIINDVLLHERRPVAYFIEVLKGDLLNYSVYDNELFYYSSTLTIIPFGHISNDPHGLPGSIIPHHLCKISTSLPHEMAKLFVAVQIVHLLQAGHNQSTLKSVVALAINMVEG